MSNTYLNCLKGCLFEGTRAVVLLQSEHCGWLLGAVAWAGDDGRAVQGPFVKCLAPWSITDKVIGKYFSLQMFPRLGQRQANSLTVQQRVCCEDNMAVGLSANYIIRY